MNVSINDFAEVCAAIEDLRAALAAPQAGTVGEAVAWLRPGDVEPISDALKRADPSMYEYHTTPLVLAAPQPAAPEPVLWANGAAIKSSIVTRERGGPPDQHTCSEGKSAYHDIPLYTAPVAVQAVASINLLGSTPGAREP